MRLGIGERQRRRRPEPRLEVAQSLPRQRMVVLLHRVVFGMAEADGVARPSGPASPSIGMASDGVAGVTLDDAHGLRGPPSSVLGFQLPAEW